MRLDLLGGIQAFVQVAETRSFAAAARNLSLSPSAVSKLVSRTEEAMGAKLLHRNTRSISLTSEGLGFLARCRCILEEVESARQELSSVNEAARGKLRVSLPNLPDYFLPVIGRFAEAYPEVVLEVDFTDRLVDVIDEGFDAVVRTGKVSDSRLISRFLTNYEMRLVGSPAYFARKSAPISPIDLERHDCIQYRFPSTGKTEVWPIEALRQTDFQLREKITCNGTEARLGLALMGRGIACLPDFLVQDRIERGDLISVLEGELEWAGSIHLLWPSNRHRSPKLRAFVDCFSKHAFAL